VVVQVNTYFPKFLEPNVVNCLTGYKSTCLLPPSRIFFAFPFKKWIQSRTRIIIANVQNDAKITKKIIFNVQSGAKFLHLASILPIASLENAKSSSSC
jgi:hypothetical protein